MELIYIITSIEFDFSPKTHVMGSNNIQLSSNNV